MVNESETSDSHYIYNFLIEFGKFNPLFVYQNGGQLFNMYGHIWGSWNNTRHQLYREFLHQFQTQLLRRINPEKNEKNQILLRWIRYFIQSELINLDYLKLPEKGFLSTGYSVLWHALTHGLVDLLILEFAPLSKRLEAISYRIRNLLKFIRSIEEGVPIPSIFWLMSSFELLEDFPKYLKWVHTLLTEEIGNEDNLLISERELNNIIWGMNYFRSTIQQKLVEFSENEIENKPTDRLNKFSMVVQYRLGIHNFILTELTTTILELKVQDHVYLSQIQTKYKIKPNLKKYIKINRKNIIKDSDQLLVQFETQFLVIYAFFQTFSWFSQLYPSLAELRIVPVPTKFLQMFHKPVYLSTNIVKHRAPAQYWIPPQLKVSREQVTIMAILDIFPGHHFLQTELITQGDYPRRALSFPETQMSTKLFLFYLLKMLKYPFSPEEIAEWVYYRHQHILLGYLDVMFCLKEFSVAQARLMLQNELDFSDYEIDQAIHLLELLPGTKFVEIYLLSRLQNILDYIFQQPEPNNSLARLLTHITQFSNAPPILFLELLDRLHNKIKSARDH